MYFHDVNYGVQARVSNSTYNNQNTIRECVFQDCDNFGVDVGDASHFKIINCDFEICGTVGDANTGAIIYQDTIDDESGATIWFIQGCWFEGNAGWDVTVEDIKGGGFGLTRGTLDHCIFGSSDIGAIRISGCNEVLIANTIAPGTNSILNVANTQKLIVSSSFFTTITDNASSSIYLGTETSTGSPAKSLNNYTLGAAFAPLVRGSTSAGSGTYATQYGSYGRNGNYVDVAVTLVWTAHTGSGNLQVDLNNIPWASANDTNTFPLQVFAENLTFTGQLSARLA